MLSNTNNKISWVHLTSRKRQLLVAMLSVTFGISMYVFLNSFLNGINEFQDQITFSTMSHIKVTNDLMGTPVEDVRYGKSEDTLTVISNARNIQYTEGIRNAKEVTDVLIANKNVVAYAEQVNQNVIFRNGVTRVSGNLSGIDVPNENRLFQTAEYMLEGSLDELAKRPDGIILGSGLAAKLSSHINDNITITTPDAVSKIFRIVGIVQTGSAGYDNSRAMISIQTARQLASMNSSYASDILVNVDDYTNARSIAMDLNRNIKYKAEPWQEGNAQLESTGTLRSIMAISVSLTILIVTGFGIYNIMNMTVNEKIREIAILKAMGFDGKDIVQIFLTQSIVIGLLGGLLGLILGFALSAVVNRIPFKIATLTTLPVSYNPWDYILAMAFGLLTTFVAGYLPAKKASRIDPVDILRG